MTYSDTCYGMGGSFNLQYYDISSKIGQEKAKNIMDTKCSIVATSCPACMIQIFDMLAKKHQPILIKHSVEIFSEALFADSCRLSKK